MASTSTTSTSATRDLGPAHRPEGHRVLALYWPADSSSPWRIHIPMRALRNVGYQVREASILEVREPGDADLVVLHRPASKHMLKLIEETHRRGGRVIVDVDDLLLPEVLPRGTWMARAWDPLVHRHDAEERVAAGLAPPEAIANAPRNDMADRLRECLAAADVVTVTTPELARAYAHSNPNVCRIPNCYDDSNVLWHVPPPSRKTVNIGFAGTEHHYDNLQLLRGALEPVAAGYPDVRIIEAGGPALLSLLEAAAEQMIHLGKLPFEVFPLLLHQMDIVLAPLVDSAFTRAKSRIRCMMAGLVGAPVVASPVGTYAEFVEHGVNGFYARSPAEWTHYLEQLVRDAELRRRMGCMNRQRAEAWSISQNIWRWTEVYESVLHRRRCA